MYVYICVCSTYMYINAHTHIYIYMFVDIVSGKRNLEDKLFGKLLGQIVGLFHVLSLLKHSLLKRLEQILLSSSSNQGKVFCLTSSATLDLINLFYIFQNKDFKYVNVCTLFAAFHTLRCQRY